jgi:hypothetical protein
MAAAPLEDGHLTIGFPHGSIGTLWQARAALFAGGTIAETMPVMRPVLAAFVT